MEIRPMPGEWSWDVVRTLCRRYQESIGVNLCFQYFDEELESLPGCYAEPEGGYWVAWDGDEAVGMVALRPIDAGCEMKRLYVRNAARGTGLGRRLAELCVEEARKRGYETIWLDTLRSMDAANHIYDSLGFEETEAYYDNPLPGVRYLRRRL
ncbi:MAG: GNAT family N-acetyltransferase [Planctomycetota bacterium]|jgi:ribosomal protein S18 acetylase RimI-like enzyme